MARRRLGPRRKRIFVAAEGEGERALATWLQILCDEQGLHVHLDIDVAGGGDTRSVVEFAVGRRRQRIRSKGGDKGALVLLDADRLAQDRAAGRRPEAVKGQEELQLIYLVPNLEGMLVRLYSGCEAQCIAANDAERRLRQWWSDYRKPVSASMLTKRFGLSDLQRAAAHDFHLRDLLTLLGLLSAA